MERKNNNTSNKKAIHSGDSCVPKYTKGVEILLVDQDALSLHRISTILKAYNFKVWTKTRAFDAMAMIRERRNSILLIMANINLPDMDFRSFLFAINDDIPVILMLESDDQRVMREALEAGAHLAMKKPYGVNDIKAILARVDWRKVVFKQEADKDGRRKRKANPNTDHEAIERLFRPPVPKWDGGKSIVATGENGSQLKGKEREEQGMRSNFIMSSNNTWDQHSSHNFGHHDHNATSTQGAMNNLGLDFTPSHFQNLAIPNSNLGMAANSHNSFGFSQSTTQAEFELGQIGGSIGGPGWQVEERSFGGIEEITRGFQINKKDSENESSQDLLASLLEESQVIESLPEIDHTHWSYNPNSNNVENLESGFGSIPGFDLMMGNPIDGFEMGMNSNGGEGTVIESPDNLGFQNMGNLDSFHVGNPNDSVQFQTPAALDQRARNVNWNSNDNKMSSFGGNNDSQSIPELMSFKPNVMIGNSSSYSSQNPNDSVQFQTPATLDQRAMNVNLNSNDNKMSSFGGDNDTQSVPELMSFKPNVMIGNSSSYSPQNPNNLLQFHINNAIADASYNMIMGSSSNLFQNPTAQVINPHIGAMNSNSVGDNVIMSSSLAPQMNSSSNLLRNPAAHNQVTNSHIGAMNANPNGNNMMISPNSGSYSYALQNPNEISQFKTRAAIQQASGYSAINATDDDIEVLEIPKFPRAEAAKNPRSEHKGKHRIDELEVCCLKIWDIGETEFVSHIIDDDQVVDANRFSLRRTLEDVDTYCQWIKVHTNGISFIDDQTTPDRTRQPFYGADA